jgi:hypothetical protein
VVVKWCAGWVKPLSRTHRDADLQRPAAADHDVIESELDGAAELFPIGLVGEDRLKIDALRVAEQGLLEFGGGHSLGLTMQIVGILDRLARTAVDMRKQGPSLEHKVLAVRAFGNVAHCGTLCDHQQ